MNTIQQGLITLLRSAVTGEALPLPEDFRIADAMDQVRRHSMATLVYAGAVNCGIDRADAAMQHLFSLYCKAIVQSEGQLRELRRLYAAFDRAGIDYMPLKGSKMKALYPKPELRLMGDADILIRMDQYHDRVAPVMEELGYRFHAESDHELVWDIRGLHVELHKRVIPSYNADFQAYFGDGWKLAHPIGGGQYSMTPEADYIYNFTHFAKHYRDGGIGCRHVLDLWVYRRSHPDLNEAAVRRELEKLGLLTFYSHICSLMAAWFEDGIWEERSHFLTEFLFASGSWGMMENRTLSQSLRGFDKKTEGKSRLRYLVRTAFPGRMVLETKYTILRKAPWTLPLVWAYRPVYKVLFERGDLRKHRRNMEYITQENMDRQVRMLRYVGLDEHF